MTNLSDAAVLKRKGQDRPRWRVGRTAALREPDAEAPSRAGRAGADAGSRPTGAAGVKRGGVLGAIRRLASEPLAHFVVVGLALWLAGSAWQKQTDLHRIVVTRAHVEQLARGYALQFGVRPDPATLNAIVARDAQEEILFRQARALRLDRDDEIVRRRMVQKMQFLIQDATIPPEPSQAQLEAWYRAHAAQYRTSPRATFSHVFFSADRGGDEAAQARARAALRTLAPGVTRAPTLGDPFPDLIDFAAYEPTQVARLFGRSELSEAVFTAPVGRWSGPFRSGYGWHLIYVDARQPSELPPLAQVRDQVRTDYLRDEQDRANAAALAKLAADFHVVRADRGSTR